MAEAANRAGSRVRTFRAIDGVYVMHVTLTPHRDREKRAFSRLDRQERARWRRYRFSRPRRECAPFRAAPRSLSCDRLDREDDQPAPGAFAHGNPFDLV